MKTLTLAVSEGLFQRLEEIARQKSIAAEEVAQLVLEEWLGRSRADFDKVVRYVMEKNAELYKRLA
jgi:antitoxin FitA